MIMKLRLAMGVILVVASLLKIAVLTHILNIDWLSRVDDEPWAVYGVPFILIFVGCSLIYESIKALK